MGQKGKTEITAWGQEPEVVHSSHPNGNTRTGRDLPGSLAPLVCGLWMAGVTEITLALHCASVSGIYAP